jgi:fibronectin-binding autotransporter adhesin
MKTKTASWVAAFLIVAFSAQTFAGTVYWDIDGATAGGSGAATANGTWDQNTTATWSTSALGDVATGTFQAGGGATPDAVFSAGTDVNSATASAIALSGAVSANSLTIEEGRLTMTGVLSSSPTLTLGSGGITIGSTAANGVTLIGGLAGSTSPINIILSANQTWNIATGRTLQTTNALFTSNNTVKLSGSADLTINADTAANGSVILGDDLGTTDYTGNITVKGGTLSVFSDGNTLTSKSSAGTGTITLGDTSGSRNATLSMGINTGRTITNPIVIAGGSTGNTITLTTVALSNSPTFSGGITMNHDLSIAHVGTSGSLIVGGSSGVTTNGYTITTTAAGTGGVLISTAISGAGGLIVNGRTTLTGLNTSWTGPITVSAGNTLIAGSAATGLRTLGTGTISLANTALLNFAGNEGNGTDYQNGTITIASGTASVAATGGSGRIRAIGNFDLGVGGTGAALSVDPIFNTLASSGVRLLGDSTINVSPTGGGTGTFNVHGGVSNSGGNYSLTKTGTGSLTLGSSTTATANVTARTGVASTYGGDTNIQAGSIRVGMNNALPTGTTVNIASGAVLDLSVTGQAISVANFNAEIAGLSDLGGGGGTVTANSLANNLAAQRTLTLNGSGNYAFTGNIVNATGAGTGNLAVTKTGSGTQTLGGGANTYSGPTTVSGGTLLVNGSLTASSSVTVAVGATLGGSGTIASDTTISGTLSAGNSPGLLTFNDAGIGVADLTLTGTANSYFEIDGNVRGTSYDAVDVEGLLTLGGTLTLDFGYTPLISDTFDLFNFANQVGSFSSVVFVDSGYAGSFDASTGILSLSAIPEPSTYAMLMGGLGLLAWLRRRNHA